MNDKILIFDIETAPDLGAVAALPEPTDRPALSLDAGRVFLK